jgi:hypothetical protein
MNTPVLKDRLLTDSVLQHTSCNDEFPIKHEHSYSLGGATSSNNSISSFGSAGSDGDSMPESPLSLDDDGNKHFEFPAKIKLVKTPMIIRWSAPHVQSSNQFEFPAKYNKRLFLKNCSPKQIKRKFRLEFNLSFFGGKFKFISMQLFFKGMPNDLIDISDMETECYPCIPMHSASNQKRMHHSTVTMIKQEPLSPAEDVNVVVDDEDMAAINRSSSSLLQIKQKAKRKVANVGLRMQQHTVRLKRVSAILYI